MLGLNRRRQQRGASPINDYRRGDHWRRLRDGIQPRQQAWVIPSRSAPLIAGGAAAILCIVALAIFSPWRTGEPDQRLTVDLQVTQAETESPSRPGQTHGLPESSPADDASPDPDTAAFTGMIATAEETTAKFDWQLVPVQSGDSMARIFARQGLSPTSLHNIMSLGGAVDQLKLIRPGENLAIARFADGTFAGLRYGRDPLQELQIEHDGPNLVARNIERQPDIFRQLRVGNINARESSLYLAGKRTGLPDALIMELAEIFQWDISFALDLRPGDNFKLLYEEQHLAGSKIRDGDILAAEFSNTGKSYTALRYTHQGQASYFAPDGRSMRKAFLRDPVHFSRVSSRFNLKRMHPIQKRVMPHRGIDYAAPRGTPVRAAGDGTVTTAARNAASGNYIVIRHGERYTTKYLHLSGFARGLRSGKRVRQGEVIGYVGSTGWATGPHLHYEFLVGGVHRNPRTVSLPDARPIPDDQMAEFRTVTRPYLDSLRAASIGTVAASNKDTGNGD